MSDEIIGRWFRERGFGPSPTDTASDWWIAPVRHDGRFEAYSYRYNQMFVVPVTGTGYEIIDVLELSDGLVKFRHRWRSAVVGGYNAEVRDDQRSARDNAQEEAAAVADAARGEQRCRVAIR
jgi:hypothetical protein